MTSLSRAHSRMLGGRNRTQKAKNTEYKSQNAFQQARFSRHTGEIATPNLPRIRHRNQREIRLKLPRPLHSEARPCSLTYFWALRTLTGLAP